ncbi:ABC transporter substrate-binding protein [Candidatus Epulonipiscium fishelsonii]|uniref:ABC transporter substrate-binding protein n=1 Tax=Candidatus Epulonipiscium fishelsonii TaxID=77094 RepID=A0ACC8XCH2_9FIRM|nr:ABC transporter substrate-binding protein [Epulopiscium sp. SCG-B11WGA-EpuloA1]ONI43187.1 ABC transporter substrate-binding protein [Epulopiscium sp. SCG-B05WGA-EpuloA1]
MKFLAKTLCLSLCLGLIGCSGGETTAETYPDKSVSLIVPFAAGGGTDLCARAIADAAKESFTEGIAVENKAGGSGAVGMIGGANSAKDGSVVTMITVELVTVPHTSEVSLSHDMFEPVLRLNADYSAITVPTDSPYNTLDDLLEVAKTEEIQIGNSGVGAIWHLAAAGLAQEAGVEFTHIPFDGAAPAITSLLGGHIDAVSVSYAEVSAQVNSGDFKVLAVLAPERLENLPDVPTAIEEGYDVSIGTWRGLAVPAETDPGIVSKVSEIFAEAATAPGFVEFMNNNNLNIDVADGETFKAQLASEYELFGELIPALGLGQ